MKTIFLKDYQETVMQECISRNQPGHHYSKELLQQAMQAQIKDNLRYTPKDGKTRCKQFGVASEYCRREDIPKYTDDAEAARWEFSGYVRNSASRISRGLEAI